MDELKDFQGTWQAVWLAEDGRKRTAEEVKATRLTISGNSYTLQLGGYEFHGTITGIDPTRSCGAVDFLGAAGSRGAGRRYRGLYVLEDDELTVCVAPPDKERPPAFQSKPGSGHRLYLLKRSTGSRLRPVEEVRST